MVDLAVRQAGQSGAEAGKQVNQHRAGVGIAASRGAQMVNNNPALAAIVDKYPRYVTDTPIRDTGC